MKSHDFNKVLHKINLGEATHNFPAMPPVVFADDKGIGDEALRIKILRSGVAGKSCKEGLENMITLSTVREVYEQHADFVYRNFRKCWLHPWEFQNRMMNELAAGNPKYFLDFFMGFILELHGRNGFHPGWLKA